MEWYYILTMIIASIVAILIAVKLYLKCTTGICIDKTRMDGKTVIVTGANTGIGFETARDLAKRGARVILACRNITKAEEAREKIVQESGNNDVICRIVDFASLASVREFARVILDTEPKIHILVNNAGAGALANYKSEDGLQILYQVNHFGPFLLTNLLLERLKESAPSRIVIVSSVAHKYAKIDLSDFSMEKRYHTTLVYSNTKLCNVVTANELAKKLHGTGVTVNSLHPGVVMTEIYRNLPAIFRIPMTTTVKLFLKSSYEGAQTVIYLAVSPEVENVSGKYFSDCKEASMNPLAKDAIFCRKVWEMSEELVGLKTKTTENRKNN